MFDKTEAAKAQAKLCEGHIQFAPLDGVCFRCRRNIYEPVTYKDGTETGITVEGAGKHFITGCPHCNYSFCD